MHATRIVNEIWTRACFHMLRVLFLVLTAFFKRAYRTNRRIVRHLDAQAFLKQSAIGVNRNSVPHWVIEIPGIHHHLISKFLRRVRLKEILLNHRKQSLDVFRISTVHAGVDFAISGSLTVEDRHRGSRSTGFVWKLKVSPHAIEVVFEVVQRTNVYNIEPIQKAHHRIVHDRMVRLPRTQEMKDSVELSGQESEISDAVILFNRDPLSA
mmetsp:Transcript_3849/g.8476  ORF Transcript_3849/g.8476 Transcript_3849/m.8476 type:complete len:210 (-) Transcript_3849:164-793(-)